MAYRILVVEDEVDTRELLAFTLGLDGYHVETAEDGRPCSHQALHARAPSASDRGGDRS